VDDWPSWQTLIPLLPPRYLYDTRNTLFRRHAVRLWLPFQADYLGGAGNGTQATVYFTKHTMREFRQLQLPKLVAAKSSDNSLGDAAVATTYSQLTPSCSSSWTTSDGSTPPTPTFSLRGHSRYSSNSSVASTSAQSCEQPDGTSSSSKLPMPKLAEEISEREDTMPMRDQRLLHLADSCM